MTKEQKAKKRMMEHVTRQQAAQEAAAMINGNGRSRWIATLVIIVIVSIGGWVIAQRVMPHAFSSLDMEQEVRSLAMAEDMPMYEPEGISLGEDVRLRKMNGTVINSSDDAKIQKSGDLSIIVENIPHAVKYIGEIAQEYGGDIANTNFYTDRNDRVRGSIEIRVVAENFDAAFAKIKDDVALRVQNEMIRTNDITEDFVDLQARLINKKNEEKAFVKVLEGAGDMDDILKVTRELARVRGEVESIEARLRYIESQTRFSRILIQIEEDEKVIAPNASWQPTVVAKQSLNRLIADMQQLIDKAIQFLTWFIPMFVLYIFVIVILWRIVGRIGKALIARWERRQNKNEDRTGHSRGL